MPIIAKGRKDLKCQPGIETGWTRNRSYEPKLQALLAEFIGMVISFH